MLWITVHYELNMSKGLACRVHWAKRHREKKMIRERNETKKKKSRPTNVLTILCPSERALRYRFSDVVSSRREIVGILRAFSNLLNACTICVFSRACDWKKSVVKCGRMLNYMNLKMYRALCNCILVFIRCVCKCRTESSGKRKNTCRETK